jgi:hypothetical protein
VLLCTSLEMARLLFRSMVRTFAAFQWDGPPVCRSM